MVRQSRSDLDAVFAALADPTRRAILARLSQGDAFVTELAAPHDMSLAAVSRHVQVLAKAGLMQRAKEGKAIRCRLDAAALKTAADWLTHYQSFWAEKLDSLGEFLENDNEWD